MERGIEVQCINCGEVIASDNGSAVKRDIITIMLNRNLAPKDAVKFGVTNGKFKRSQVRNMLKNKQLARIIACRNAGHEFIVNHTKRD